ncbi:hypothetical protein SteCoe_2686 [Stentor coeruleus]|uniref:Protein kinase domain-containing protein n=1 Tax=Stentor coeruleus TaxID=5963 RepID=A0A1R2CYY4_9CILI|nr:hypothetical protein SteCoe_2686 [Stentor coeruleus]
MERYRIIKNIGDGTFGSVSKAAVQGSNEIVAVKKMKTKFYSWEECLELQEIKVLRKITHQNIIKLKEVVRANNDLSLIFEYCDKNLYQLMTEGAMPEDQIRDYIKQILTGLSFLHKSGIFHRDIKSDNILMSETIAKIADFGLAREIRSSGPYTEYYRAPEVLLRSKRYSWPVDIFAVGCITAELFLNRPIFPGTNEIDQLNRLCSVLGTPNDWSDGQRLASSLNYIFPQYILTPLNEIIHNASNDALDFIQSVLKWDPNQRPTAEYCLQHPFILSNVVRFQSLQVVKSPEIGIFSDSNKPKNKTNNDMKLGAGMLSKMSNVGIGRHKLS